MKKSNIGDEREFPFLVLGNKLDLEEFRQIKLKKALEFCYQNGNMIFMEVSAKDHSKIERGFKSVSQLGCIR